MNRRRFLRTSALSTVFISTGTFPLAAMDKAELTKVTILHTNDVHSRIEPFPMDGSRAAGMGGAAKRAALIEKIRQEEEHVLLLDAGDIFQGTPYFNFFGGELEFKLMSEMRYDAATIGNHDFDAGIDGLFKQLPNASFPFVSSNYDFSDTVLHSNTHTHRIVQKGDVKIGLLGVGIELEGLVPKDLYKATRYLDPLEYANKYAKILKKEEGCDYVICLSHLGFKYEEDKISDMVLAKQSEHIDLIIGGHTHTFLDTPIVEKNRKNKPVVITQVGWGGMILGRLDVLFERNRKKHCTSCDNILVR